MTMTYTIASTGHTFQMADPVKARVEGTVPFSLFHLVLVAVNELASSKSALLADGDLSNEGRARRVKPLNEAAVAAFVVGYLRMIAFDAAVDARESQMLAVPTLDPSASAHAQIDLECRSWYRNQSLASRTEVMNAVQNDPEAGKRYERLVISLLRSPLPLPADHETAFFAALWKQTKRLDNPGIALELDADRNASDWAWRGLGFLHGVVIALTGWSRAELLNWLVVGPERIGAAKAFGFGVLEIEAARRQAAARKA